MRARQATSVFDPLCMPLMLLGRLCPSGLVRMAYFGSFEGATTRRTHTRFPLPMVGIALGISLLGGTCHAQDPSELTVNERHIVYHDVRVDSGGAILPWYSDDPAQTYDHDIRLVWDFWSHMRKCPNGIPYYLQHQVWKSEQDDPRGIGGDQINMALDSWNLLYDYLGDPAVKDNMVLLADYWLDHGISSPDSLWHDLPFPYNTTVESGQYDGDMRAGKDFLQPDKAGSFGAELVMLYKKTGNQRYLNAATRIADTLSAKVTPGDANNSPWPFRVNAVTGEVAVQEHNGIVYTASYTSNWSPTLRLFDSLADLKRGHVSEYRRASHLVTEWLKKYPLATNRWGPFFEDINEYSDTEINADTMALYILEHPSWDRNSHTQAQAILSWSEDRLSNHKFVKLHVLPLNEQTAYLIPGNSHTSRHASVELLYSEKTGDHTRKQQAIRRLNWATYSVATDGANRYPTEDIWLTDGYGDYVRHYLRAMASLPELAPKDQDHLLRTSSVVTSIAYGPEKIVYTKFDARSVEKFKLGSAMPSAVSGGKMKWDPVSRVLLVEATAANVVIALSSR